MYNGILILNKPKGFTSHDAAAKLRRILNMKKIGHAGTLDPMASGVLVMLLGKATRASDAAMSEEKGYEVHFRPGLVTDTQDITGNALSFTEARPTTQQVARAAEAFIGDIDQLPPMYSAIQIGGQRLYKAARKGKEIERPTRRIHISDIRVLPSAPDLAPGDFRLFVACSKGTYIRALCHDLGQALGCGGCMSGLTRVYSGEFSLREALTLDEIAALHEQNRLSEVLSPPDRVFGPLPRAMLRPDALQKLTNGIGLAQEDLASGTLPPPGGKCRLYTGDGRFAAVAECRLKQEPMLFSHIYFLTGDET